ncbi:MAG TPA: hypothetical protein DHV28_15475 [Ignavibacteriales bacterium]|nr:hypothetical protein [Ignavibacteriales bacterium]
MVKRTEQVISKVTVEKFKSHPELVEGCDYFSPFTLRQAQCDNMILENNLCHFDQREKSVFHKCKRFLSRRLLRNDRLFYFKRPLFAIKLCLFVFLYSLTFFFLAGCANQLPPGGGEVDKIPPEIIYSYPETGTINFKDDHIEFEFSEYVDKRSFKEALFISPAIDEQPEINWSGTSVEIVFPKGLKDNVTYVITIGTDVVDVNNKNRMANSYSFTFSTGDKIDKRIIDGKVYGKDIDGTLIFAYKFLDDTTKYLSKKPDYISQVGKDGNYQLKGLAESVYRVFAVKDQMRDLLYQADQDLIGMPNTNISLLGSDSSYSHLDFFLMKVDTLKPRLLSTVMTDNYHLVVTLSEECDSLTYLADNFEIIDSTTNKYLPIEYSYQSKSKKEEFVLVQNNKLSKDNIYYLHAKQLKDLDGNIYLNELSGFVVTDKPDTTTPKLIRTNPSRNGQTDFKNPEIFLYFDDAITNENLKNAILFTDTLKNRIDYDLNFIDNAVLLLKPKSDLKPDKSYEIKIDLSKFKDAAGNKVDSVYTFKFATINGVEFTGISGKIITTKTNVIAVLQDIKDDQKFVTVKPDKTMAYSFDRMMAGTYSMWVFSDTDSSGTFNKGYPDPFKYSEDFYFVPDTLKLRPRWIVTDFNIVFEK